MLRYLRIAIVPGVFILGVVLLILGLRSERIPDHVMNSPPAVNKIPPGEQQQPQDERPKDLIADSRPSLRLTAGYRPNVNRQLDATAADALSRIGQPSLPVLVEQLQSGQPQNQILAADILARMGPAAVDAAEPLVERLEDADEQVEVKLVCARAIGQIGPALWPAEPEAFIEPPTLEPLPEMNEQLLADPQMAELRRRQETRRIEYGEFHARRKQQYYDLHDEYLRRRQIAQRAVDALAMLAMSDP